MHTSTYPTISPKQMLTFSEVCSLLRRSRAGVYRTMAQDPTFPRSIKHGEGRASRAFFVADEIAAWQKSKLDEREAKA